MSSSFMSFLSMKRVSAGKFLHHARRIDDANYIVELPGLFVSSSWAIGIGSQDTACFNHDVSYFPALDEVFYLLAS